LGPEISLLAAGSPMFICAGWQVTWCHHIMTVPDQVSRYMYVKHSGMQINIHIVTTGNNAASVSVYILVNTAMKINLSTNNVVIKYIIFTD